MLLEFSVENYRSIRDKQVLSMLPDEGKKEHEENIFQVTEKLSYLKSAVIFGANASGKSNLIRAMKAFKDLIAFSPNYKLNDPIKAYDPFKFNEKSINAPCHFSIAFLIEKVRYVYEVSFLEHEILTENLLFYPQGREAKLFMRKGQKFDFGDYLKGRKTIVAELTGKNQLFLSKGAINNMDELGKVSSYFLKQNYPFPLNENILEDYGMDFYAKKMFKEEMEAPLLANVKALFQSLDTGIVDFEIRKNIGSNFEIITFHKVFDINGNEKGISEHTLLEESAGTQKLFVLAFLLSVALMKKRTIILDEFERSLHPHITTYLIQLFHNHKINSNGAQLIVATHDPYLLSESKLRRDQIWMVEKDNEGVSELYSLADVAGVRADIPFDKWYLSSRFGGVPGISRLNFELNYQHEKA